MAKKLYIGGLSYSTTQQSLQSAYENAGIKVEQATVIMDKMTGKSRGFGFVTLADDSQLDAAIEAFNKKELDGRVVTVNEARPMEDRPRPQRSFDRGGDRGGMRSF